MIRTALRLLSVAAILTTSCTAEQAAVMREAGLRALDCALVPAFKALAPLVSAALQSDAYGAKLAAIQAPAGAVPCAVAFVERSLSALHKDGDTLQQQTLTPPDDRSAAAARARAYLAVQRLEVKLP